MTKLLKTLTPQQIEILHQFPLPVEPPLLKKARKPLVKSKKNNLSWQTISSLYKITLPELKNKMEEVTLDGLRKAFLDNEEALFYAMYNPDFEVFKHIYTFCKNNNLARVLLASSEENSFRRKGKRYYWKTGDTLLNIALILASPERIDFLVGQGLNKINCPNFDLPEGNTIKGNLITWAAETIDQSKNLNSLKLEDKINYYLNFALFDEKFDTMMGLKPYSDKNEKANTQIVLDLMAMSDEGGEKLEGLLFLIYYKPLYQNESFVKIFLPNFISTIWTGYSFDTKNGEAVYFTEDALNHNYAKELVKRKPVIKTLLEYFEASPFYSDSQAVSKISRSLIKSAKELVDDGVDITIDGVKNIKSFSLRYEAKAEKYHLQKEIVVSQKHVGGNQFKI